MTTIPPWADAALSDELPLAIAGGESQTLEFKEKLPEQLQSLAKEIAGFATSNAGRILIGVDDACVVVGFPDGDQAEARNALRTRIEGLCQNVVRPPTTPALKFAFCDGKPIAVIEIPKGAAPIYYVNNIPYLRQMSAARPMTPEEVVEHVLAWNDAKTSSPEFATLESLDMLLRETDIDLTDFSMREANPWRGNAQLALSIRADQARRVSAGAPHELRDLIPSVDRLAELLDEIASERRSVNASIETIAAHDEAEDLIRTLRARWVGPGRFGPSYERHQRDQLLTAAKQLAGLVARIDADPIWIKDEVIKTEAASRGYEILSVASAGYGVPDNVVREELRRIGAALRLTETRRLPADGGQSRTAMIEDIRTQNAALESALATLAEK